LRIGDQAVLSDAVDGFFSINAPSGNLTLTVTYTPTGGSPIVRSFPLGIVTSDVDLGDVYIGPEEVAITGFVVDSTTSTAISGATIKMAGRFATTDSNGIFTLTGVAYSSSATSVFLGLQGEISANSYFTTLFSPNTVPTGTLLDVGQLSMTPIASTNPPPLPTNLRVTVSPNGSGATVVVKSGAVPIRTGIADPSGVAKFWLPVGSYSVEATKGTQSGTNTIGILNVNSERNVAVTIN
jgi:hypothetical protein